MKADVSEKIFFHFHLTFEGPACKIEASIQNTLAKAPGRPEVFLTPFFASGERIELQVQRKGEFWL